MLLVDSDSERLDVVVGLAAAAAAAPQSLLSDDGLLRKTHADGIERRMGRVDVLRREKVNLDEQVLASRQERNGWF